jgi:hypothetical protein
VVLYCILTLLWLPLAGIAAEIAVNMPTWLVALGAGAAPQTVFVLLGAGKSDDDTNGE